MPARTRSRSTRVLGVLAATLASATLLAACGSDDSTATSTPSATTTTSSSAAAETEAGESSSAAEATGDTDADASAQPPVTSPSEAATAPPSDSLPPVDDRGQAYLDALREAGVSPADEASAIGIADYVCGAQAEGAPDDAVVTIVTALVGSSAAVSGAEISEDAAAAEAETYISVASENYCG